MNIFCIRKLLSTLTFNARQYFEADYFRSASDLFLAFKKNEKRLRKHVVLFIDEYNILYIASDRNLFLETLHGIKNTREMFAFWSAVAIGLLAFCVIEDTYAWTNGHAAFACLCKKTDYNN
ncbi:P-loop containing nucleoside triphosphate hydrolase protein [Rhizophagus irregularis DAOM 181602=DAOM 197198]|nr:P-loop containing nucleoside triphosphate hydrolase protein [Rhizophagus irregularis DAOM 181602=DAOM 197198]